MPCTVFAWTRKGDLRIMSRVGLGLIPHTLIHLFMQGVKIPSTVRGSLAPPLWWVCFNDRCCGSVLSLV